MLPPEATRLLNLYKVQRTFYSVTASINDVIGIDLNQVVSLTYQRFDLAAGKLLRVMKSELNLAAKGTVQLASGANEHMNKALLCFPNRADAGTLTGGAWTTTLPLSNVQDKDIKKIARTSNAATASTQLTLALSTPQAVRLFSLVNTNLGRTAKYRIRWARDAALTQVSFDSGWTDIYPVGTVPYGSFEWEEDGFWDGRSSIPSRSPITHAT